MSRTEDEPLADPSARAILRLIRSGEARSRAEIARAAGLSPSTVTTRVQLLIDAGYLREAGEGASQGGRRPRTLEIDSSTGVVCSIDLGSRHATIGLLDLAGTLLVSRTEPVTIGEGPEPVLAWAHDAARRCAAEHAAPGQRLVGLALALPGPVDSRTLSLVSPSRMPGWNGVNAQRMLADISGLPTVVDNDANLAALGEHRMLEATVDHMVFVKAGSSIGCGVITAGSLYRGHHGMAGDISHVTVPGAPEVLCSCGRKGCLDAVAGGAAIVRSLRAEGVDVADSAEVLALAKDAHPLATRMLREAGVRVGGVLATIMNFYNPMRLVLGGILGEAEAFVAGVQSAIYADCLPMITNDLTVCTSIAKEAAGVRGGGSLILDHLFESPATDEGTP